MDYCDKSRADCYEQALSTVRLANEEWSEGSPEFDSLIREAQVYATLASVPDSVMTILAARGAKRQAQAQAQEQS